MYIRMVFLFVIIASALAELQRSCYKCLVKNQCQELDTTSVEICEHDVHHCVKKTVLSKATGVMVTERYCGGRDFLDISSDLIHDKCYAEDIRSRTTALVCYCSTDYCNTGYRNPILPVFIMSCLFTVLML